MTAAAGAKRRGVREWIDSRVRRARERGLLRRDRTFARELRELVYSLLLLETAVRGSNGSIRIAKSPSGRSNNRRLYGRIFMALANCVEVSDVRGAYVVRLGKTLKRAIRDNGWKLLDVWGCLIEDGDVDHRGRRDIAVEAGGPIERAEPEFIRLASGAVFDNRGPWFADWWEPLSKRTPKAALKRGRRMRAKLNTWTVSNSRRFFAEWRAMKREFAHNGVHPRGPKARQYR